MYLMEELIDGKLDHCKTRIQGSMNCLKKKAIKCNGSASKLDRVARYINLASICYRQMRIADGPTFERKITESGAVFQSQILPNAIP